MWKTRWRKSCVVWGVLDERLGECLKVGSLSTHIRFFIQFVPSAYPHIIESSPHEQKGNLSARSYELFALSSPLLLPITNKYI